MKQGLLLFLLVFCAVPAAAQDKRAPERVVERDVRSLPTCIDYTDVYASVMQSDGKASAADEKVIGDLAAMVMGYVSALQDIYGNRLIGLRPTDNEWTLLEHVNAFCRRNPQMTFERAVRQIPAVRRTIQSLQDQEFDRCQNYINNTKSTICSGWGVGPK